MFRLFIFILILCVLPVSGNAQIVLTKLSDMFFGVVEYDTSHTGFVQLGTNGSLSTTGSGFTVSGVGIAGQVEIAATPADVVEVRCDLNGRMALPTGELVNINRVEGVIDVGVPFGSGTRCDRVGRRRTPIATVDIAANPTPIVLLGARARIRTLSSGVYDSTNGGGRPITVRVLFQ